MCVGGVPYIIGKISTRATTLCETSFQSKVYTKSYGPSKWQESQFQKFKEFQDSQFRCPKKNDIGSALMANHKEYFKGKGGGFLQVWAVISLMSSCMFVIHPCNKSALTVHKSTCCLVMQV
jgi:hypothetical protein